MTVTNKTTEGNMRAIILVLALSAMTHISAKEITGPRNCASVNDRITSVSAVKKTVKGSTSSVRKY